MCVPKMCINMLKCVFLKMAKICRKCANFTDRKNGVSIVSQLERSPVCTHFFAKYESFSGMSRNVPKCAIIIDKYADMSVSTLHLMTSHCSLNMLMCVPEIAIIMLNSVFLKIAKYVQNVLILLTGKLGSP